MPVPSSGASTSASSPSNSQIVDLESKIEALKKDIKEEETKIESKVAAEKQKLDSVQQQLDAEEMKDSGNEKIIQRLTKRKDEIKDNIKSIMATLEENVKEYKASLARLLFIRDEILRTTFSSSSSHERDDILTPLLSKLDLTIQRNTEALLQNGIRNRRVPTGSVSFSQYMKAAKVTERNDFWLPADPAMGAFTSRLAPCCLPGETEEKNLQLAWVEHLMPKGGAIGGKSVVLKLFDTHAKKSGLEDRFPDLTFIPTRYAGPTSTNIAMIGELSVDDESPSKFGEILSCAQAVLELQPTRPFMYSFLATREKIWFLRTNQCPVASNSLSTHLGDVEFTHEKCGPFALKETPANDFVVRLLTSPLESLGWAVPEVILEGSSTPLNISFQILGQGLTSTVYRSEHKGEAVAVKCLSDEFRPFANKEFRVLKDFRGDPNIIQCQGLSQDRRSLILSPICAPFLSSSKPLHRFTRTHVAQLVDAVRAVHSKDWIHRDIRPDNICYFSEQKSLVLTDFGFALERGAVEAYSGTFRYASSRILDLFGDNDCTNCPGFACEARQDDDLHSLIRCVFILSKPHLRPTLNALSRAPDIRGFWSFQGENPKWKLLSDSIPSTPSSSTYDTLKAGLEDLQ